MIKLRIDNREVRAEKGMSILQCAASAGIEIPAMCTNPDLDHFTSCMICVVKEGSGKNLLPACSTRVWEGMDIVTNDREVMDARKIALELLLSEHAGDCEAPCRLACPAFMDIPAMNRLIAEGNLPEAMKVVSEHIALPAVLGRICHAPCENACKRKVIDQAVSICLLKRYAADMCERIPKRTSKVLSKRTAIIGSGPAGLSAAFYLLRHDIGADLFDMNREAGGMLRYGTSNEELDMSVLDREIEIIESMGAVFNQGREIDKSGLEKICRDYDAVVLACGKSSNGLAGTGNIPDNIYIAGNPDRPSRHAVRSVAQGREAAIKISGSGNPQDERKRFNSVLGRLGEEECAEYLKEGSNDNRQVPAGGTASGFNREEAEKEAARCLHCDCRKAGGCMLRDYSDSYSAVKKRFLYTGRKSVKKVIQHGVAVYEPGKCIKCGICVRLTAKYGAEPGFTFIGKGFDVEIGVPFSGSLRDALGGIAAKVTDACPTGALSGIKNDTV